MPPSFHFPFDGAPLSERADLWVPIAFRPDLLSPDNRTMEFGVGLVGRLKAGVTREQAKADMESIAADFMKQYGYSGTIRVAPRTYLFAAHAVEKASAAGYAVDLGGCVCAGWSANVANLLLARGN
jgi:hypothetical protein